jgi:carbonic anhydrase
MKPRSAILLAAVLVVSVLAIGAGKETKGVSADQALQKLMDGNKRYTKAKLKHPDQDSVRRAEVAKGQHPYAIIIGCADSRVPPEIIFDQGLGDLFIIRIAGNVIDNPGLGSIEYGVEHLNVKLVMVLGHEKCGAVDAAVKGSEAAGHIGSLIEAIKPAVEKAKTESGDMLDNAVKENVKMVVAQLKASKPILAEMVEKGKIKIVGARYDLDTGAVELIAP